MPEPMTQEEFVADDGLHCPYCRGDDIDHEDQENYKYCYDCSGKWRIEHEPIILTGYKIIRKPNEN